MKQEEFSKETISKLHRSLNLRDLILLNISCIVGISTLAQVAQFGFATLPLYVLAIITFLIPSGLMVAELNARMPEEGGFYLWTRKAFGDWHGYVAAWTYWLSGIVWLPTVMLLVSASGLYIFGQNWLFLADNPWYNGVICIGMLWVVTLLNIFGLEKAKWIQNIGGTAVWLCVGLLFVVGIIYVTQFGSEHVFKAEKLIPDFTDFSILPFFAIIAYSFGGLELAPIMASEIEHPKKNIPKAILISALVSGLIYITGTLMLLLILPEGKINVIDGVAQAFHVVSSAFNIQWIGVIGAVLIVLSNIGLFGAWMTGTARVPFVVGLDHYLPEFVSRIHPKWGSPYVSLLMQSSVLTVLILSSIMGSTVKEAFMILLDMSIILYFIPFLYMFSALIWHHKKKTGNGGMIRIFRRKSYTVWLTTILGFGITLFSMIISVIPTKEIENKQLFVLKVLGGALLLIGAGLIVYYIRKKK